MTHLPDESRLSAEQEHPRATIIQGDGFVLRPASIADQRPVYEWLAHSDIASAMNGPPIFPEKPIPTWDEFCDADCLQYFTDSAPQLGRSYLILVNDVWCCRYHDTASPLVWSNQTALLRSRTASTR